MDLPEVKERNGTFKKFFKRNTITQREKLLSLSLILSCFVIVILVISVSLFIFHPKLLHHWTSYYLSWEAKCMSPVCVAVAGDIMKRMDKSVDPCTDFYQFTCGGLDNKYNVISDYNNGISTRSGYQEEVDKRIRALILDIDEKDEFNFQFKIKTMYDKCMNSSEQEALGDQPLIHVLNELGGWPVTLGSKWNGSEFNLEKTLVSLKTLGFNHDFLAEILVTKSRNIWIGAPILGLNEHSAQFNYSIYYTDPAHEHILKSYLNFMVQAAVELCSKASRKEIQEEMEAVLNLEKKIAKLMQSIQSELQWINPCLLQSKVNYVNWTYYLNGILSPYVDNIRDHSLIAVANPDLMSNISSLVSSVDNRVLANYIGWRVVYTSSPYLSDKWVRMSRSVNKMFDGRPKSGNRWQNCIFFLRYKFTFATSSLYLQNLPGREDQQTRLVKEMIHYLKTSFIDSLENRTWIDDDARSTAITKAKMMTAHVGYHDELLNDTIVNEFYSLLNVSSELSFLGNVLNFKRFAMDLEYVKLKTKYENGHWIYFGLTHSINAWHYPRQNAIFVPLSIIKGTEVDESRPMYLNFGHLGWTLGHEIIHGFDSNGRFYDEKSEYRNWFNDTTDAVYKNKSECFAKQYELYDVRDTDLGIDGQLTLGENIADNGGIKFAFQGYKKYMEGKPKEASLPGLDYNAEQLFFIQAAGYKCARIRKELREFYLKSDTHSPGRIRVLATMSNSEDFSQVFHCKSGSPMNPPDKCQLW